MTDISKLTEKDLCFMFDHTNLKAYASSADIQKLCEEASQHDDGQQDQQDQDDDRGDLQPAADRTQYTFYDF